MTGLRKPRKLEPAGDRKPGDADGTRTRKPGAPDIVALTALCCGSLSAALGHHSNRAIYNREKILSIEGIVTEVWYQNPHSRVYVEVTGGNGDTAL